MPPALIASANWSSAIPKWSIGPSHPFPSRNEHTFDFLRPAPPKSLTLITVIVMAPRERCDLHHIDVASRYLPSEEEVPPFFHCGGPIGASWGSKTVPKWPPSPASEVRVCDGLATSWRFNTLARPTEGCEFDARWATSYVPMRTRAQIHSLWRSVCGLGS